MFFFSIYPQKPESFHVWWAKTLASSHAEVDMSDYIPNHHHSDLVYGNHLSTEQTPPSHHRGIFQRLSEGKSNISRRAGGENVVTFTVCLVWCLFRNTNAYGLGLRAILAACCWKRCCLKQHDDAPSPRVGQPWGYCRLLLFLSRSLLTSVGNGWASIS